MSGARKCRTCDATSDTDAHLKICPQCSSCCPGYQDGLAAAGHAAHRENEGTSPDKAPSDSGYRSPISGQPTSLTNVFDCPDCTAAEAAVARWRAGPPGATSARFWATDGHVHLAPPHAAAEAAKGASIARNVAADAWALDWIRGYLELDPSCPAREVREAAVAKMKDAQSGLFGLPVPERRTATAWSVGEIHCEVTPEQVAAAEKFARSVVDDSERRSVLVRPIGGERVPGTGADSIEPEEDILNGPGGYPSAAPPPRLPTNDAWIGVETPPEPDREVIILLGKGERRRAVLSTLGTWRFLAGSYDPSAGPIVGWQYFPADPLDVPPPLPVTVDRLALLGLLGSLGVEPEWCNLDAAKVPFAAKQPTEGPAHEKLLTWAGKLEAGLRAQGWAPPRIGLSYPARRVRGQHPGEGPSLDFCDAAVTEVERCDGTISELRAEVARLAWLLERAENGSVNADGARALLARLDCEGRL